MLTAVRAPPTTSPARSVHAARSRSARSTRSRGSVFSHVTRVRGAALNYVEAHHTFWVSGGGRRGLLVARRHGCVPGTATVVMSALTLRQHRAPTPLLAYCWHSAPTPPLGQLRTVGTPLWSQVRQHRANVETRTLVVGRWTRRDRRPVRPRRPRRDTLRHSARQFFCVRSVGKGGFCTLDIS